MAGAYYPCPKTRPDVILLDMNMPLMNGLDAGRQIKKLMPEIKIIFLTVNEDPDMVNEAMQAGASGYLIKNSAASELLHALREVMQGRSYITHLLKKTMEECFVQGPKRTNVSRKLTPRQREVLRLLSEGYSMKEVANFMNVTPRTIAIHKYRIMEVLRLKRSAELLCLAIKEGLVVTNTPPYYP